MEGKDQFPRAYLSHSHRREYAHTVSLALSANLECTERLSPIISNESSTPFELGKQRGKGLEIELWRRLRLGEMRLNQGR